MVWRTLQVGSKTGTVVFSAETWEMVRGLRLGSRPDFPVFLSRKGGHLTPSHVLKIVATAGIQPDAEIWTGAALTHELCSVALHYDEALGLPLPLHLAKQMEEYVLLIDVDEEVTPK